MDTMQFTLSDGTIISHSDVRNSYGLMHAKATYTGVLDRDDGKLRPFILSRSGFIGMQKFSALWTGDNRAYFEELPISMNMII